MAKTTKGFEIALNLQEKILRLRVWGDWDVEFEKKYDLALREKIIELCAQAHWQIWYVLVDFTGFAAIAEERQRVFGNYLQMLRNQGLKKIAYLCDCKRLALPFRRARDEPFQAAFQSREDAMTWLLHG